MQKNKLYKMDISYFVFIIFWIHLCIIYCPCRSQDEWHALGNKTYYVSTADKGITFSEAQRQCSERGAHLPVITNAEQNEFIRTKLENSFFLKYWLNIKAPTALCTCMEVIPSACQQCRESWMWLDGTSMAYWNWGTGRPQAGGRGCGYIYGGAIGNWDDTSCSNEGGFRFVCQYNCVLENCVNHRCMSSGINYTCSCPEGFTGVHCDTEVNECLSDPCMYSIECIDGDRSYTCTCLLGYTGQNCETNINDCESTPCQNGGTCLDYVNSYICQCPEGYSGEHCQSDENECMCTPCLNGGTCTDFHTYYNCTCLNGFSGLNCESVVDNVQSNNLKPIRIALAATAVVAALAWIGAGVMAFLDHRNKKLFEELAGAQTLRDRHSQETGFHNLTSIED